MCSRTRMYMCTFELQNKCFYTTVIIIIKYTILPVIYDSSYLDNNLPTYTEEYRYLPPLYRLKEYQPRRTRTYVPIYMYTNPIYDINPACCMYVKHIPQNISTRTDPAS